MLADTLKNLHDTEDQAEQILVQANLKVREIEKQTYQRITQIENNNAAEIAAKIAALPQPTAPTAPTVHINVPQTKFDAAVDYLMQAVHGV